MRLIAIVTAIPMLISGMLLIYALGIDRGPYIFVIALTAVGWTEITQQVRSRVILLRQSLFVEAARNIGLTDIQLMVRHLWPNVLPELVVISFLEMGGVLLLLAELGFMGVFVGGVLVGTGLGGSSTIYPDVPEWSQMLSEGTPYLRSKPFVIIGPAVAFFIAIVGLNTLGEGLRNLFDKVGVNTSVLLRKRFYLALGGLALASYLVIAYTGPHFWYSQAASEFEAANVNSWVDQLEDVASQSVVEGEASAIATYLADQFKTLGLEPGWQGGLFDKGYTYMDEDGAVHVLGLWTGYEGGLSREMILIFTTYGGPDDGFQDLALMLEIVRFLKEQDVNPRRSLMFVAWQEGTNGPVGAESYFTNARNFRYLGLSLVGVPPVTTLALQIEENDEARFWVQSDVHNQLFDLIMHSAEKMDAQMQQGTGIEAQTPVEGVVWGHLGLPSDGKKLDRRVIQDVGETLALTLIHLARDEEAWKGELYEAEILEAPISSTPTSIPTSSPDEVSPAIAEVIWSRPAGGSVYQPGDALQIFFYLRGAPGAYLEGEAYTGARVQVTVQGVDNGEEIERWRDLLQDGMFIGYVILPRTIEPGEYMVKVTALSESLHGHPLELAGETTVTFTVKSAD
jgi:hypothetical protein